MLSTYSEALRCTQADWSKLEEIEMDSMTQDEELLFERHKDAYRLFELFEGELPARFPDTRVKVPRAPFLLI